MVACSQAVCLEGHSEPPTGNWPLNGSHLSSLLCSWLISPPCYLFKEIVLVSMHGAE